MALALQQNISNNSPVSNFLDTTTSSQDRQHLFACSTVGKLALSASPHSGPTAATPQFLLCYEKESPGFLCLLGFKGID